MFHAVNLFAPRQQEIESEKRFGADVGSEIII
jgi:hypothetical protein